MIVFNCWLGSEGPIKSSSALHRRAIDRSRDGSSSANHLIGCCSARVLHLHPTHTHSHIDRHQPFLIPSTHFGSLYRYARLYTLLDLELPTTWEIVHSILTTRSRAPPLRRRRRLHLDLDQRNNHRHPTSLIAVRSVRRCLCSTVRRASTMLVPRRLCAAATVPTRASAGARHLRVRWRSLLRRR